MNRNQAKEFYPILQAFAEGRVIECRTKPSTVKGTDVPNDWTEIKEIGYWDNIEYRIKPETKYRPFANTEECWAEMLKHKPLGWLYEKESNHRSLVTDIYKGKKYISINGIGGMSLDAVMKYYTFVDGTSFGIKVEE